MRRRGREPECLRLLGGLPVVKLFPLIFLACAALSCEKEERKGTFTTRERSQAVVLATSNGVPAAKAPAPPKESSPGKVHRALCGGRLEKGGRNAKSLPKQSLSQLDARAEREVRAKLGPHKEGFTWVNFWAAWCEPCKEEIPRLLSWQKKLGEKLALRFVSVDDDARQLHGFLASHADLTSTYWLKEGKERDEWMSAAGIDPDPELPLHLLVDTEGKIRCRVQGAVEDQDFDDLTRLLESGE